MLGIKKKYLIKEEPADGKPSIHGRTKKNNYNYDNDNTGFCLMSMSELHKPITGTSWRPVKKAAASSIAAVLLLIAGVLVSVGWIDASVFSGVYSYQNIVIGSNSTTSRQKPEFLLECSTDNDQTQTCPRDYPTTTSSDINTSNLTCPSFFRWIHEDLRHWKQTGITQGMIERARKMAHFRLVIVNGRAYVEKFRKSIQTRDKFTLWGILQLLRLYPGRLPDLELMFDCDDRPIVRSLDYQGPDARPPPLFRYCSDESSMDIVFPDWSFWGWAETNIRPWGNLLEEIKKGNQRTKWEDRVPYAYWKDLMKCNVTDKNNWNTLLYVQDWGRESKQGFKQSNLEDQCTHRYKIYTEGWAWSVSEKYILACDSMTLYIRSQFYDFFIRGMVPLQHYWPIRVNSKCKSLKFAVEWGNLHPHEAKGIGEAAGNFIQEDLKMDNVYDYIFHLLNEYANLLKFKPVIPPAAVELCSETMACQETSTWRKFMEESLVMSPRDATPCAMPPPYKPPELQDFLERKANSTKQVEMWEDQYWLISDKKQ
ncbi:O-glucosyltransferase rumi homolog isoform X2 [Hibiscus syriacus]|uniref:O-glucosyltransferase rumi homolog isoform X2 n=1 Tax=Hibiscus syriacus TaxID=106335 RepID=UPI00192366A0|nr:O-glucosyltransferase rumi homolog isoform X2 [Hibiscus syriacus]